MSPFIVLPQEVATAFTGPEDIAGLNLWLDGFDKSTMWLDTAGTIPADDFDEVARWDDKSGNNYHFTNEGDPNELPILIYDEAGLGYGMFCDVSISDQGLGNTNTPLLSGAQTIFMLVELNGSIPSETETCMWRTKGIGGYQELLLINGTGYEEWTFVGDHSTFQSPTVGVNDPIAVSQPSGPEIYLVTYTYNDGPIANAASYGFRLNQVDQSIVASGGVNTNGTDVSGFGAHMSSIPLSTGFGALALFAEFIIYDSVLSPTDILNVENYLLDKYLLP